MSIKLYKSYKTPSLGGSTPIFPKEFNHLLTAGKKLVESRQDPSLKDLYRYFRKNYKIREQNIHFAAGATMGFFETLLFLRDHNKKIIFEAPFYEPYLAIAKTLDFDVKMLSWEKIVKAPRHSLEGTIICISNPNFFTGTVRSFLDLNVVASKCKYLIIDEVFYSSFSDDGALMSPEPLKNSIRINSFSKSFGLSMLRLGWVTANSRIIKGIAKKSLLTITDLPTPSIRIANKVLRHADQIISKIKLASQDNRAYLKKLSTKNKNLQLSHNLNHGHFVSIRSNSNLSKYALNGNLFGAPGYWRFRLDKSKKYIDAIAKLIVGDLQ